MARRRKEGNDLPKNLYENGGYFKYRHPIDRREYGLGRDRAKAILTAEECNRSLAATTHAIRKAEGLLTLLTHDEIVAGARAVNSLCGVYFLISASVVVYVGQSMNLHKRIATHIAEAEKQFDSFHFVQCQPSILDELEQAYIATLKPKYNIHLNMRTARAPVCTDSQHV